MFYKIYAIIIVTAIFYGGFYMKILAIDGNSILNRAFYGIKMLSNSKGFFTNAITGFLNIYLKECDITKPDFVVCAFDLKEPTFRHKAVASYKANRKGMPPELAMQLPVMKEILKALGVLVLETPGFEADDILGTISDMAKNDGNECYILTGDRDSLQLINDSVTVRLATNKETISYTPQKFREDYSLEPIQLIELKALMGDSSDNISGVKGIGEKTASQLIIQCQSIERLYEMLDEIKLTPSVKTKLTEGKDSAFESRWLATIVKNAPVEVDFTKAQTRDNAKLCSLLTEYEMFKLIEKLDVKTDITEVCQCDNKPLEEIKTEILTDETAAAFTKSYFTFDGESLRVFCDNTVYTPLMNNTIDIYFESSGTKLCFDAKTAYKYCFENGIEMKNLTFSADLAGYLLNSQSADYTIENLCMTYKIPYRADMGENADIASLEALCTALELEIKKTSMEELLYKIEMPLCEVLASMETLGVMVDRQGVEDFGRMLTAEITELEQTIYDLCGKTFNIASPKQLGVILFEDLGLPCKKKTKSGYSTSAEVLEELVDAHPVIPAILEYRTLTKLNSTYVDGLLKVIRADNRVHSTFKQTETRTGRISSTEPNVQNIPVRKEIGRNMRKFFVAKPGYTLLDADYSQIELRVLAGVCGDDNMQKAFLSGKDIHTSTAASVFNVPEDFVDSSMRSAAKAVNFGIIYGIGAFSLSKDIGVSVSQAKEYIKSYLANYPNVSEFMDKTVEFGLKNGYVSTIFGRRRYIPELLSSNKMLQAFGKRAAMNAPIQGAAADIIKIAMVRVYKRLKEEKLDAALILQVHDELIVECALCDIERAKAVMKEEMENAVSLSVPLIADVNEGNSWYIAKG